MKKNRKIRSIVIVLLVAILGSLSIEVCANISAFFAKQHGIIQIDKKDIEAKKFKKKSKGFELKDGKGKLRYNVGNEYVKKFVYSYDTTDLVDATITIGFTNSMGTEETAVIVDKNPILLRKSVVNINKKVKWIELSLKSEPGGSGILIKKLQIDNRVTVNEYRVFGSAIIIFAFGIFIINRKKISKNIEYGFVVIATALGLIFVVAIPANKVGWDEETHFKRAYQMSIYPGGEYVSTEIDGQFRADTLCNFPDYQPQSYEEKKDWNKTIDQYYKNGDHAVYEKGQLCGVYTVGLVPQAFAIKVARNLGMSFDMMFLAGRLAELLVYIFVMYWAIKIIPVGKRILTFISLIPTSMFLAVTYTYDTIVYSFIMLAIAILMKEWLKEEGYVSGKNIILANIFMIIGCLPKAVYAPVALLGMFIPSEKYKSKTKRNILKIITIITFLVLMSSFVIPQMLNPNVMEDARGGAGVDSGVQMSLVLGHPIAYAGILMKNILACFAEFSFATNSYRLMGHIQPGGFQYLIPIMVVILILTDYADERVKKIKWNHRVGILILLGASVAFIWTALYIAFNKTGTSVIEGVQGSYYRPLLWLLYLICSSRVVTLNISEKNYNRIILALCWLITGVTTYGVWSAFCI